VNEACWTLTDISGEHYWTRGEQFSPDAHAAGVLRFSSLAAVDEEAARVRRRGIHLKSVLAPGARRAEPVTAFSFSADEPLNTLVDVMTFCIAEKDDLRAGRPELVTAEGVRP
jgi:hypothetical protein